MLSDRRAVEAVKLLYSGCTIASDRKLRKALDMIDEYEHARGRTEKNRNKGRRGDLK